jgi:CHAT domain-containing protein
LLRAGLAFAGLNANASMLGEIDTDNDGVLTAMEVLSLDLVGTQLVVLSACETGLGEIHEGEGVYGLRRSFQEAGVKNVINSFWEVSDAGTQLLMTKFYDKFLTGMSARRAMREARLEMLDDVQWSAPFYWSAFVMVGRNT